jgi:hypothetical protein
LKVSPCNCSTKSNRMACIPPRILGQRMVPPPRRSPSPIRSMVSHVQWSNVGHPYDHHPLDTHPSSLATSQWRRTYAHDAKAEDIDLKKRTHFRIIRLHQCRKDTLSIHHEYFFDDPDAILLATTLTFQRNWLNLYESAILESVKSAQTESISGTKPLSNYFPVTRPGIPPKPKFDNRLHTHHKIRRSRKHKLTQASSSTHRLTDHFKRSKSPKPPNQHRNSSTHIPR